MSDVISNDKQPGQLLGYRSATPTIVQGEQHDSSWTIDRMEYAINQHSLGHHIWKAAMLNAGPHEDGLLAAQLALHRAQTHASICADAVTAAAAASALAARLGQQDKLFTKLTAAHTANDAAEKALQEAEAAYMPYKLQLEIASQVAAVQAAAFEHEQKRFLGVYQKCKHLHHGHRLAEQAADTRHGSLTIFRKLQRLVSKHVRSPAADAAVRPNSSKAAPAPIPKPTAVPPSVAAPQPGAHSTAEYLRDLAKMCKERWGKEFETEAAAAADKGDAYHQLQRWKAAWTHDSPRARLRELAKMIKNRAMPQGLDRDLISSKDVTLAVLEGLPWLLRNRQALFEQDQQNFGYAWAMEDSQYQNKSPAAGNTSKPPHSSHCSMQQKLRWQQLQQISPAAARHMFLASAVNFTLAATRDYSEAVSRGWLTWPALKLSVAQQASPRWLNNQALPAAKLRACLHAINTPGQGTTQEKELQDRMLTDPSEVQYRRQLRDYSVAGYPEIGVVVGEGVHSASRLAGQWFEQSDGASVEESSSRCCLPQIGPVGYCTAEGVSTRQPVSVQREPVYVVISRAQLPSHVNNAEELKKGKVTK